MPKSELKRSFKPGATLGFPATGVSDQLNQVIELLGLLAQNTPMSQAGASPVGASLQVGAQAGKKSREESIGKPEEGLFTKAVKDTISKQAKIQAEEAMMTGVPPQNMIQTAQQLDQQMNPMQQPQAPQQQGGSSGILGMLSKLAGFAGLDPSQGLLNQGGMNQETGQFTLPSALLGLIGGIIGAIIGWIISKINKK